MQWANGRLTELSGFFTKNQLEPIWEVISHNDWNTSIAVIKYSGLSRDQIEGNANKFKEEKYSHEFYHYYLDVIKNANCVSEFIKEAVTNLFYWKLGKVSKQALKREDL